MERDETIKELVSTLDPITLEEMSSIRLMNRIDTKFVTDKDTLIQILQLAHGDYYAQQIGGKRIARYRTTYWDTDDHFFYITHHNGCSPRHKVRVRTYLDSDGLTFLEVKNKNNHGRTKKKRIQVPAPDRLAEAGADAFLQEKALHRLDQLHPALQNQFERITLVNRGKTERLTIDFNIQFINHESGATSGTGNLVVVELKRDGNVFSPIKDILLRLRIKPSGFSKYCIGMAMTDPGLKRNNFRERLHRVGKFM